MGNRYLEHPGYDLNYVYSINIGEKPRQEGVEFTQEEKYDQAMLLMDRVKRYPGVEAISFSRAAMPYGGWHNNGGECIVPDSSSTLFNYRWVTPSYFDVFKIKLTNGRMFDWPNEATQNEVILSPGRHGVVGDVVPYDPKDVKVLTNSFEDTKKTVIGNSGRIKTVYFSDFIPTLFIPIAKRDIDLSEPMEITIRVSSGSDKGFKEKFENDMKDPLNIGPYYFTSLVSQNDTKEKIAKAWGVQGQINGVNAITIFLILNIFLGILGTFWFRTEARRSEIALRIALGASKRKVKNMMVFETTILLSISAIIATIICINVGNFSLLQSLGIPETSGMKGEDGFSIADHAINFGITYLFLFIVSVAAVWYPAKQASETQPAKALHDE
jgi:putative ABC transport system permease protein